MILTAPPTQYPPAPEGNYPAVCVDFIDLGDVQKKAWGDPDKMVLKHMCEVHWELDEIDPKTGERFLAKQEYKVSLHEKANLYAVLLSWGGRAATLPGFDTDTLIGKPCLVQITHNLGRQGQVFANVAQVAALPKGVPAIEPSGKYVRRPSAAATNGHQEAASAPF